MKNWEILKLHEEGAMVQGSMIDKDVWFDINRNEPLNFWRFKYRAKLLDIGGDITPPDDNMLLF